MTEETETPGFKVLAGGRIDEPGQVFKGDRQPTPRPAGVAPVEWVKSECLRCGDVHTFHRSRGGRPGAFTDVTGTRAIRLLCRNQQCVQEKIITTAELEAVF